MTPRLLAFAFAATTIASPLFAQQNIDRMEPWKQPGCPPRCESSNTPPAGMKCPGDKVVWVNTRSHVYHFQGERYFGKTSEGKFLCEGDAVAEGYRPEHKGQ